MADIRVDGQGKIWSFDVSDWTGGKPERIYSWIGNEIEIQEFPSDGRLQKRCGVGPAKAPCVAKDIGD